MVLASVEIGFRIGRTVYTKSNHERESPASSISSVILGLLAFMLAFTFSIVSERYERKKSLVREEANVIRTAFNRADFLPDPDRETSKNLISEYLDQRIAVGLSRDKDLISEFLAGSTKIQKQLWAIAVANGRANAGSETLALYIESVNEIANLHATRVGVGLLARIPTGIWFVLLTLLTLGMVAMGYHTAIADSRRSRVTPILAIAFGLTLTLIAALDNPGDNFVPISQISLVNVQAEIKGP